MFHKQELRIPGPTPVPPQVLARTSAPMVNHRGKALYKNCTQECWNV